MNEEELRILIKKYLDRVQILNDTFELYYHLQNIEKFYLSEMNIAPAFFQLTRNSLLETAVTELPKLFDCRSDTGLKNLLCICFKNANLFRSSYEFFEKTENVNIHEEIIYCEVKLLEVEDKVNLVKGWRDKYFAHLERKYFNNPDKLTKDFPLIITDFKDLIKISGEICNKMLVNLGNKGELQSIQSSNVFDIDNLLEKLKK